MRSVETVTSIGRRLRYAQIGGGRDAFPCIELITPVEWWDNLSLRCPRAVMVDLRRR